MSRAPTSMINTTTTTSALLQVNLEAAPPTMLRLERRPSFRRRLDTIQEEREGTTPRAQNCSSHANPPAFGFGTGKYD